MRTSFKTATWLSLAVAIVFSAAAMDASAQTRFIRSTTFVQPVNVNVFRPAQSFPTVGNPRWYLNTNNAAYSNPNNYINYSYLNAAVNPFGYGSYYPTYNPTVYPVYPTYNPYVYPAYNPYAYWNNNPYLYSNPYAANYGYGGYGY